MPLGGTIANLVSRWAHAYNDGKAVDAAVTYAHFAGMLVAGGVAVVADRFTLALAPAAAPGWTAELDRLAAAHRWVIGGLVVVVVSGVLMTLSDLHTYATSAVFWVKMALFVLLLGNGWVRQRAERAVRAGRLDRLARFRGTSVASLTLWFAVLLAGTLLNIYS